LPSKKKEKKAEDSIKKRNMGRLDAKGLQERKQEITKKQIANDMFEEERRMRKMCGTNAAFTSWQIDRDEAISTKAEILRMLKEKNAEMDIKATKVHIYVYIFEFIYIFFFFCINVSSIYIYIYIYMYIHMYTLYIYSYIGGYVYIYE
jgi:hypothetical protein